MYGGPGADRIRLGTGADRAYGGAGDDLIRGGGGSDTIYGKSGKDTLVGGSDQDFIHGGRNEDTLRGNTGRDLLNGNAGDDELDGGAGEDGCSGGSGNDTLRSCNEEERDDAQASPETSSRCDSSYPTLCLRPRSGDLDCSDITARDFRVVGSDPHNFDGDGNGIGCETQRSAPETSTGRVGAICRDGWRSQSTGSGTCSSHGGVDHWLYG